jgi:hypothetical protein
VAAYTLWSDRRRMEHVQREIDDRLLIAAEALEHMLATDFHDRAVDAKSISFDEEMRNRTAFNAFASQTGFKWIYTLAEKDGKFYFSAPTVSDEEARERKVWYFYPYDDIPPEFVAAFRTGKTSYVTYADQWGRFRSVALPRTSPGGRRYLSCADIEVTHLAAVRRANTVESVLVALFFLLCCAPMALAAWLHLCSSTSQLRRMNAELKEHKARLETLVDERTSEVDLLSGLVPICSHCKRIRDDRGYWNQLEKFLHDHSGTRFSHGICPECADRLFPELELNRE